MEPPKRMSLPLSIVVCELSCTRWPGLMMQECTQNTSMVEAGSVQVQCVNCSVRLSQTAQRDQGCSSLA